MAHKKEEWKEELYGDAVREKLFEFAERGFDSVPEDEREKWFSRFKFWGVFHQRSGQESYFMLRISNAFGVLDPGQLRTIAEVAQEYATGPVENPEFGNGWLDLTTRQSVQLHWLRLEDVPQVFEKLEAAGVSTRSSGGDTMRNITGCPTAGKDAREVLDTAPLLERFDEELRGDDSLASMPRKFNISVTGIPDGAAQDAINDVALEPARKEFDGEEILGFNMRVGGGLGGKEPRRARSLDVFVPPEKGYEAVRGFVELYHDHGDRQQRSKNRSRFFVDEWGTAEIRELLQAEYVDFELPTAGRNFRDEYVYNAGRSDDRGLTDYVGVHDQDEESKFVGLSVPVGRLPAEDALALADLAEAYGSGEVRLTRRQNPLVMDVPSDEIDDLLAEPLLEKYPPEPSPFQRGGMACTGTEFCSLALTETKARLARMLRWLRENVDLPDDVDHLHVHFSGCTADCGHANTADIGLLGMRARKDGEMVEAMDIGVGGGLGTEPSFVEWIHQRVPADEVPGALKNLVEAFAAHREERVVPEERRNGDGAAVEGQTFREWCSETGTEALVELCEPEETTYEDPYLTDAKRAWYPFAEEETAPEAADVAADD